MATGCLSIRARVSARIITSIHSCGAHAAPAARQEREQRSQSGQDSVSVVAYFCSIEERPTLYTGPDLCTAVHGGTKYHRHRHSIVPRTYSVQWVAVVIRVSPLTAPPRFLCHHNSTRSGCQCSNAAVYICESRNR